MYNNCSRCYKTNSCFNNNNGFSSTNQNIIWHMGDNKTMIVGKMGDI